ncbi:methyltransferase domain-containing protein [Actinomadura vinacea]|uniref:Methyltransferase domain-containing protein n=1 Tax=Actinomadura vinacea TaxID=115336 RepID=A0ABP5X4K6_9ACTN
MSTSTFDELIHRLDLADARPDATALRTRSYDLLRTPGTQVVADVGCGSGRAVAELADRGVQAIGVDLSEQMIAAARRRHPGQADAFRVGDACALPFGDGELTGYRAERVLHDLPEPERAIAEARRVLAPGGRAVLVGQDWDGIMLDSDRPALTRTLVQASADRTASPRAARAQRRLLLDGGFGDVTVEAGVAVFTDETALPLLTTALEAGRTENAITDADAAAWLAEQRDRARAGRALVAVPIFLAAATRR